MDSHKLNKGSVISVGKPAEQPIEMINALVSFFEGNDMVEAASLAWKVHDNEAGYLLVIDSKEEPRNIMPILGDICQPYLKNYMLDITYKNTALGEYIFSEIEPFYLKK